MPDVRRSSTEACSASWSGHCVCGSPSRPRRPTTTPSRERRSRSTTSSCIRTYRRASSPLRRSLALNPSATTPRARAAAPRAGDGLHALVEPRTATAARSPCRRRARTSTRSGRRGPGPTSWAATTTCSPARASSIPSFASTRSTASPTRFSLAAFARGSTRPPLRTARPRRRGPPASSPGPSRRTTHAARRSRGGRGLVTRDNLGATEEGGEQTTCVTPGDDSPFGKTVWFRFDAPDKGVAHFTASGFDTVMAVYAGGSPNYLACDDDPNVSGPSQLNVDVARGGVYYVQVGGYGGGVVSRDGELTYGVTFDVDRDWDDDGVVGTTTADPTAMTATGTSSRASPTSRTTRSTRTATACASTTQTTTTTWPTSRPHTCRLRLQRSQPPRESRPARDSRQLGGRELRRPEDAGIPDLVADRQLLRVRNRRGAGHPHADQVRPCRKCDQGALQGPRLSVCAQVQARPAAGRPGQHPWLVPRPGAGLRSDAEDLGAAPVGRVDRQDDAVPDPGQLGHDQGRLREPPRARATLSGLGHEAAIVRSELPR